MKRFFYALMLAALLLPVGVFAQDEAVADEPQDILELSLYGGFGLPGGGAKDFGDSLGAKAGPGFGFDFGVFITPNTTIGLGFVYNQFDIDNDNPIIDQKHRLYSPRVYARHFFMGESDFVPFVKLHAGVDFNNFSTEVVDDGARKFRELAYSPAFAVGGGGGIFLYTADYSGFFLEASYHHAFAKDADKEYKGATYLFGDNYGILDIHAGLQIFFGSDE